jgi:hypothetical protein
MPATIKEDYLSPDDLLLDPNNFRFQDSEGFVYADEARFHEDSVQKRALERLRDDQSLASLKNSILKNGYIPIERLVVRPSPNVSKWVVIEGNRRLAAVKWILDDHSAGVKIPPDILSSIKSLPVVIAEQEKPDAAFRASLMGIRHVSGIKAWGGYQRAKLVAQMRDEMKLDPSEIAERLAMTTHEVNRRYRAFKALQQMQGDDDFSGFAKPTMYPMFHEAVSVPAIREWLAWDDGTNSFTDDDKLKIFYSLITPSEGDEEEDRREPKITTYSQVRELRNVLSKPETIKVLLDPARSFEDALALAKTEELVRLWETEVAEAIRSLEAMTIHQVKNLTDENCQLLLKLVSVVQERITDHASLTAV